MRKPFPADFAKVEVCFAIGDKKYRVERILKKNGTNEGRLYIGESLIAGPKPTQVTERVEKELQVSYELFARAVYSEQNQVDYFLKLNPGERKKKFDELLDLQKYEIVRGNANQVLNHFRKSRESTKQSLSQFDAVLQQQDMNELRFKLEAQKQKKKDIEHQLSGKKGEKESLSAKRMDLQQKVKQSEALQQSIQSKKGQLHSHESRLSAFAQQYAGWDSKGADFVLTERKSLAEKIRLLQSKQEQHRLLDIQRQKAQQRMELVEQRKKDWESKTQGASLSLIESRIHELKRQKLQLQEKLAGLQSEYAECLSITRLSDSQLGELGSEADSLQSLHANCPTCRQEISSDHKKQLMTALLDKRQTIESQRASSESRRAMIQSEKVGLELVLKGLDPSILEQESLRVRVQEGTMIISDMEKAKLEYENAEKALAAMGQAVPESEIEAIRKQVIHLEKVSEMLVVKNEFDRLVKEITADEVVLTTHGNVRGELDSLNAEWARFESEWNALEREKGLLGQVEQELEARVKSIESLHAQKESLESKLVLYSDVEEGLGIFSNALIETQQQLREGVVEAINAALLELWPALYPYQDFSLAKLQVQDNDYVLSVREKNGGWVEAESSLSGGERSAAALALRMAVAFVLTRQLSWIILDEPTHNLDVKSVNSLSSMLRERLPGLVDQVFVITHAPEIEKAATGSLYVLERNKNEDGPTTPVNKLVDLGTRIN